MAIVTTTKEVLSLTPSYDPVSGEVDGLAIHYKLAVLHGGTEATHITTSADVWGELSQAQKSSIQATINAALNKLG